MSGILWFVMGIISTLSAFIINKRWELKKNYEKPYLDILQHIKDNKLNFTKRLGDAVYFSGYKELEIIYNLRSSEVMVFDEDECILVSIKEIKSIIKDITYELEERFYREIYKDIIVLNGITYSSNMSKDNFPTDSPAHRINGERSKAMTEFVIEDDTEEHTENFKLDDILSKIEHYGFDSLNTDEKEFINNTNNWSLD